MNEGNCRGCIALDEETNFCKYYSLPLTIITRYNIKCVFNKFLMGVS